MRACLCACECGGDKPSPAGAAQVEPGAKPCEGNLWRKRGWVNFISAGPRGKATASAGRQGLTHWLAFNSHARPAEPCLLVSPPAHYSTGGAR